MDIVPHGPPILAPPLVPIYEPASTPTPALEEGLGPREPIHEQQNALENPTDLVPQWNSLEESVD